MPAVWARQQNIHLLNRLLEQLRAMIDCACWGRPLGSTQLWEQHLRTINRILYIANHIEIREVRIAMLLTDFNNFQRNFSKSRVCKELEDGLPARCLWFFLSPERVYSLKMAWPHIRVKVWLLQGTNWIPGTWLVVTRCYVYCIGIEKSSIQLLCTTFWKCTPVF